MAENMLDKLFKLPYNREAFIDQWIPHFIKINKRKPTKLEVMSFKIGFDAAITMFGYRKDDLE